MGNQAKLRQQSAKWLRASRAFGLAGLAAAFSCIVQTAHAQSAYACNGLENATVPVVEGRDGMFFQIETDLLSDTRIPWPVIDEIARVSEAFAKRGSELVVVPLPTKGLVASERLGSHAQTHGFNEPVAERLYRETLARLSSSGVTAVDALGALRAPGEESAYLASDPRLSNAGILRLSEAVATALGQGLAAGNAKQAGRSTVPSVLHQQIQARCNLTLPQPETVVFDTVSLTASVPSEQVVLVSAGQMSGEGLQAVGLFETAMGRDVAHVEVSGNPVEAMLSVVANDAFHERLPEAVVWILPVSVDLASRGFQPFHEMSGLVSRACRSVSSVQRTDDEDATFLDLSQMPVTPDIGLMVDLEGEGSRRVDFVLTKESGATFRRSVVRLGDPTPRVLLPFSGLRAEEITSVTVRVDGAETDVKQLSFCGV